jgi:hypothetical protein
VRPDGQIRRSQIVSTFGPGALVDLVDDAVLVGGLEFWRFEGGGARKIHDPRLRDAIVAKLPKDGPVLSFEDAFLEPPAGDDKQPMKMHGIESLEFPQWFVCQRCRALVKSAALELKNKRYRHQCNRGDRGECVPVRFVGACNRGHVQDYPWIGFVHSPDKPKCDSPDLKLREGATGDFSEVVVRCESCRQEQRLSRTLAKDANPPCGGERPWLGRLGREDCEEQLRLLVRTASNAYFAQVDSALSVPDPSRALDDAVQNVWDVLKEAAREDLPAFRKIPKVKAAIASWDDTEVVGSIQRLRGDASAPREPMRSAEFRQLSATKLEEPGDLPKEADGWFHARTAAREDGLTDRIAKVVLASRLREVRVQIGFTRLTPASPNIYGEVEDATRIARLTLAKTWLPACEIHGEGVFIQLGEKAVREWEARAAVKERAAELRDGFVRWAEDTKLDVQPYPVRFYLLHSLSHLLASAISLECGYAASAIRERIYCSKPGDELPMAAILLATGTPGTEGTLGGLVEEGRRLRAHLGRAFDMGTLCSNDPVCAAHVPKDESERWLEGAACHGCLFVAESSCERFNRFLDRALVVPTIGHPAARAFFAERP